jgi:hypothetical protein
MSKHTPGPWHVHEGGDNLASFFVDSAKEGSVCKIAVNHHEEANARLIATAPEMLEELRECRKELLGASSYLATCDPITIVQNLDSFIASLRRRLASVEAVIGRAEP